MLALVLVACVVALQGACTYVRDPMNSGPGRAQVLDVIMKSYSFAIIICTYRVGRSEVSITVNPYRL